MNSKGSALPSAATLSSLAAANTAFHTPRRGSATARFELIAEQLSRPTRLGRTATTPEKARETNEEDHDDVIFDGPQHDAASTQAEALPTPPLPPYAGSSNDAEVQQQPSSATALRPLPPTLSSNITRLAMCMAMDDVVRARVAGMLPDVLGPNAAIEHRPDRRPLPSPPSSTWSEICSEEWRSPSHFESKEQMAKRHFTTTPPQHHPQREPLGPEHRPTVASGPLAYNKGLPWVAYEYQSSHGTPSSDAATSTKRHGSSTWARVDSLIGALDAEGSCQGTSLDLPPSPNFLQAPEVPPSSTAQSPAIGFNRAAVPLQATRPIPIKVSSETNLLSSPATSPQEHSPTDDSPKQQSSPPSLFSWISEAMDNLLMAGLVAGEVRTRTRKGGMSHSHSHQSSRLAAASTANNKSPLSTSSSVSAEERAEYLTSFATAAAFIINAALLYAISSKLHMSAIMEEAVVAIQRAWARTVGTIGEIENTEAASH